MLCSGNAGLSGCTVAQSCNLAVHLGSTNQALLRLTCLPRSMYHEGLFCWSSIFSIFIHLTTITSVAASKRSFGNKSSPPRLLPFAQTLPRSCSYPSQSRDADERSRTGPDWVLDKGRARSIAWQTGIHWHTSKH